jgi:murein DD-endopeptidase MepM/ murein hydrolase activator NlpD
LGGINVKLRYFFVGLVAAVSANFAQSVDLKPLEVVVRPTRVFKTADRGHENTESWIVSIIVQVDTPTKLAPATMTVSLLKGSQVLETNSYSTEALKSLTYKPGSMPRLADGSLSRTAIFWPFAIRLRRIEPVALGADAMRVNVEASEEGSGVRRSGEVVVPIETYRQKTPLIFPFRGKGIILQGGGTSGGHRNRSGMFAIDAFGLDEAWSIIAPGQGKENGDYRGWGRELIAPADGVVVRARNDRPDQPVADASDPKYYAPEYKEGGDPGNYLVIDHGASEFSMIAHFQAESMLVKTGDRVHQGQALGKLGHSGDSSGPHCHYQLQAGPDWENADGLPCRFSNVNESFLDRGTYFEAK